MINSLSADQAAWRIGRTRANIEITQALSKRGYHIFANTLPSHEWFSELYDAYDIVSDFLSGSDDMAREWEKCVHEWHAEADNKSFFCGVPPAYRDKSEKSGKRDKEYIQYTLDFAKSKYFSDSIFSQNKNVNALFDKLYLLNEICVSLFSESIASIETVVPSIREMYGFRDRFSPVVLKVLRYNRNPLRFATGPHFDKSALSLLLHSSDKHPRYLLSNFKEDSLRYSDLFAPIDYPSDSFAANSAVLINGLCLRAVGADAFPPTPHSVLPVCDLDVRHSVVAFLLLPHLDTSQLSPKAIFENDIYPDLT